MKKTTKSMLVSALILFLFGVVLALSAALFVKIRGIDAFGIEHPANETENKSVSLSQMLEVSENSNFVKKLTDKEFIKISLQAFSGDIILQSGDETTLSFTDANLSNLSYEIIGETLTVSENTPVGAMGVYIDNDGYSFHGLRQIFGGGNTLNTKKTIVLTVDRKVVLENVQIQCGIGSIVVDGANSSNFDIRSQSGNITVKNLNNNGSKLNLVGNTSIVSISDCIYAACSITTKFGVVRAKIPSELCKSTVISAWIGNVDITCDVPTSAFKLTLDTKAGSVYKNGENLGKEVKDSSQLANRITAETFVGKIHLSFVGENESDYVAVDHPVENETAEIKTEETQTMV